MTRSSDSESAAVALGRPKAERGPKLPHDEVDRLLVEGELVTGDDGVERRVWPSQRDLAKRYGVAPSLIGRLSSDRACASRRKAFQGGMPAPPPSPPSETIEPEPRPAEARRRPGRPRRGDGPAFPHDQVFDALVYGELVEQEDGTTTTVYPSYREVAERHGVAVSVISEYAKSRNVPKRRELARSRFETRREEKLIELRAEVASFNDARMLAMLGRYFEGAEASVIEGRMRIDSMADVDKAWRLKSHIEGGPDARLEVRGLITLEALQQRYEMSERNIRNTTPAMTGYVPRARFEDGVVVVDSIPAGDAVDPPSRAIEGAAWKPSPTLLTSFRRLVDLAERVCTSLGAQDAADESLPEMRLLRLTEQLRADLEEPDDAGISEDFADDDEESP